MSSIRTAGIQINPRAHAKAVYLVELHEKLYGEKVSLTAVVENALTSLIARLEDELEN